MFNLLKTHSILFPPPKNVWHCVPSPLLPPVDPLFCFSQMYLIPLHPSLECSETCHYLTFFFSLWSPIFLLLPFCFLRQSLSSDPPTFTSGLLWQPSCLPCNHFRSLSLSLLTKTSVLVPVPLYITKRRLPLSQMSSWPEETEMVDAVVIVVGICPGWWSWLCP